ncbi:hypothetical protein SA2016_4117 (plasmid) [Sinomonas atrocyanea]|uniref:Uncharacterized protein n=1 Tax=Sinomonas atrocyanea TaxID=37927 RepID=A0A127A5P7_9MICC|nr:hypothetical protein [Sinomonas atrocyanea]AMM34769.1 hypothetical protein SA2016_4117 [Sinomonas atrocyanea]GGG82703.1 hypothetical protein GCM10007172_40290 [Sinomonas atrocyanea]
MDIIEETGRTGTETRSGPEKAIASVIALMFAAVSTMVGAAVAEALSQLF